MIARRPAAAIAIPKRQQEFRDIAFLHTILPSFNHRCRVCSGGIIHMKKGDNFASIHPLPGKVMIWERLRTIVCPEYLLRSQVFHAASLENLRQNRAVSEGIRQPKELTVNVKLFLIEPLAMHNLANQRFAGSHIGIRFHPHTAICNPLTSLHFLFNLGVELRIKLFANQIALRLTLNKLIFGVQVHQSNLLGKCPRYLALCFPIRPQPADIQMGIADCIKFRCKGSIMRLQHGMNAFSGTSITSESIRSRLFKIHNQCKALQCFFYFRCPKRRFVRHFEQITQHADIQPKLIGFFVPDSPCALTNALTRNVLILRFIVAFSNRTCRASSKRTLRKIMSAIGFQ